MATGTNLYGVSSNPSAVQSDRDLLIVPHFTFTFVDEYVKKCSKASGDRHISEGYKYFNESYIHNMRVQAVDAGCRLTAKCYRSQRKNEAPHSITVALASQGPDVTSATCTCPKGLGSGCGHIAGVLYQLANLKMRGLRAIPEDAAKTSLPQTSHQPRGEKTSGTGVPSLTVVGYNPRLKHTEEDLRCVQSTLFNPIRGDLPNPADLRASLLAVGGEDLLIMPALGNVTPTVATKLGQFPKGSVLAVQQKEHEHFICNIYDGVTYPDLPAHNLINNCYNVVLNNRQIVQLEGLSLNQKEVISFERRTRLQGESPLWHRLRRHRITDSNVHAVFVRGKDMESLVGGLMSTRKVQTAAMAAGIQKEPHAAVQYATCKDNRVNVYPSGIVVSPWAPWLAASPDRKVYDPTRIPPFGLLEIKCPVGPTVLDCKYLQQNETGLHLKMSHSYTQIQTQLAVTGLQWCDFFVRCDTDSHLEEIRFNPTFWQSVKDKVDIFFFDYFLYHSEAIDEATSPPASNSEKKPTS